MELANRCLCWISCNAEKTQSWNFADPPWVSHDATDQGGGDTHVEVGTGELKDELRGVRLVLTVVHVHLELIGLQHTHNGGGQGETASCSVCRCLVAVNGPQHSPT